MCPAHANVMRLKENLSVVLPELSGHYAEFITFIDLAYNNITVIPEHFFSKLTKLLDFKIAHNFISEIPGKVFILILNKIPLIK